MQIRRFLHTPRKKKKKNTGYRSTVTKKNVDADV